MPSHANSLIIERKETEGAPTGSPPALSDSMRKERADKMSLSNTDKMLGSRSFADKSK